MSNNSIVIVFILIVIAAAFLVVARRRSSAKLPGQARPRVRHDESVAGGAASAAEDVYGEFLGVDAHPDLAGPADDLSRLKGLGPKAAAQLNALGITRYAHLAALDDDQIAAVDKRMGVFRGRIERDRWVEQARHLAGNDIAGFEAKFGKLGS